MAASIAAAAPLTPTQIIRRHVAAANAGDPEAMAADYAPDAVILEAGRATRGRDAIRATFARIFGGPRRLTVTPVRIWRDGDVGFIRWTAAKGAVSGQDTYVVRDGQIAAQAVYMTPAPAKGPGAR